MVESAIAGGASTLSRAPQGRPANWPTVVRMKGALVYDVDGTCYVDYESGLLSVLLGHAHPIVLRAVRGHLLAGGPAWPGVHPLEEQVADTVRRLCGYPYGLTRFFASGSHACEAAVRVARAITGRDLVLSIGYHGWPDAVFTAAPGWGVPHATRALTVTAPWGDLAAAENVCFGLDPVTNRETPGVEGSLLAALIIEPVTLETPPAGYLEGLAALADRFGFLLIFDECISGGRYERFTYGHTAGPLPDLTVVSKGLANGFPLAALVGEAETLHCFRDGWRPAWADGVQLHSGVTPPYLPGMSGPVYASGTWSSPGASLAAAEATLRVWQRERVWERLCLAGRDLRDALYGVAEGGSTADGTARVRLHGPPYRMALETRTPEGAMDYVALTLLRQELVAEGVLCGTGLNLTAAHRDAGVLGKTVEAWQRALRRWQHTAGGDAGRRKALIGGKVCVPAYRQA